MFILLVLFLALVVAWARGGRISNLVEVDFRHFYLLCLPLVLQLIIFSPLANLLPFSATSVPVTYVFSMFVGAVVVWLNRHLPGFVLLLVGLVSNLAVIAANGGYMPVSMEARAVAGMPPFTGVYNNVVAMSDATPLWFLGDLIPIPRGVPLANVFSIGDVFITLGGVVFIQVALVKPVNRS